MKHTYRTKGTCSTQIDFEIENDCIHNVVFTGGCNGNLKAISALVEGQKVDNVVKKLKGITCGFKQTSCADQLSQALEKITNKVS